MMASARYSEARGRTRSLAPFEAQRKACPCVLSAMTALSARQIDAGMAEAAASIEQLSTGLLEAATLAGGLVGAERTAVCPEQAQQLAAKVMETFGYLQFADRMQQRMNNVASNLGHLAESIQSDRSLGDSQALLEQLRDQYTMQSERDMFDAALAEMREAAQ